MQELIGAIIRNTYRIESQIGSGGMGVVYKARHAVTNQQVAVKVISPKALADPDRLQRFRNEAKISTALSHPNIVRVLDVGFEQLGGEVRDFIVMEYVEGVTLAEKIAGRPLPLPVCLDYGTQIAAGLDAAHRAGITHRDIKPTNILVDSTGAVKLADFGLAKLSGLPVDVMAETVSVQMELTQTGTIIGSIAYMSPEQARGFAVDPRSDIFSFGAVLYEMLTGKQAFPGETTADKLSAVLTKEPAELPANIPVEVSVLLSRCLRKNADHRWQTARDLRSALEDLQRLGSDSGSSLALRRTSKRRTALAAVAGAAASGAATYFGARRKASGPRYQRLTFRDGDITGARFAPNNLVAYTAAWDGGPPALFTCQPGNREPRRVEVPPSQLKGISGSSDAAVITPEGTLLLVALGGGEPRPRVAKAFDACWGPDGTSLAVVTPAGPGAFQVEYPAGRKLHESYERPPQSLRVSPDGGLLAFFEYVPELQDFRLTVIRRGGGKPQNLISGLRAYGTLVWRPDGREIWFSADRVQGDPMVYGVDLAGRERVVTQGPQWLILHDIDAAGRLLVADTHSRLSVQIGGPAAPNSRSMSWLDSSVVYDISPGDKSILFAEVSYGAGGNSAIYLRSVDGSPARKLGEGNRPCFSKDGQLVICLRRDGPRSELSVVPNGPGEPARIPVPGWSFDGADWMPGNQALLAYGANTSAQGSGRLSVVVSLDGRVQERVSDIRLTRVSPDGQWGAGVNRKSEIVTVGLFGVHAVRVVAKAKAGESVVRWSDAGMFTAYPDGSRRQIDRIDPVTGVRSPVCTMSLSDPGAIYLEPTAVSPSGRLCAVSYQRDTATLHLATGLE